MAVNQGLKTFAESSPDFNNQGIQNLINPVNIGFVLKTRTLAQKVDASTVLTVSQKNDLNSTLDTNAYLNIGRVLEDLDLHTVKIFTGELGEQDPNSDEANRGSFVDHIQSVQGFIGTVPFLYGYTADSINKGVAGHFGTVSGTLDSAMKTLRTAVEFINSKNESTDTAFQTATQNISNFLDTLGDSTAFDESTFNSLQSAFQTASDNFNTTLTGGQYTTFRTNLINSRKTVVDQIALEVTNLGVIRTYEGQLAVISSYVNMTTDADVRNLMIRTSNNANFREYFEQYANRTANKNNFVHINENILTINGKTSELKFGNYTNPIIFNNKQKDNISLTDKDEKLIYLFDSNSDLVPNFPVFGSSKIDLFENRNSIKYITSIGESNEILVYSLY
mgnify:CR=1 FL=1